MNETLSQILNEIQALLGKSIPNLIGALLVLVVGWLVSLVIHRVLQSSLRKIRLDDRVSRWSKGEGKAKISAERWIARTAFYLLMLIVLVMFFHILDFPVVTEPITRLLGSFFEYVPQLLAACVLLLLGWIVANGLRLLVRRTLESLEAKEVTEEDSPVSAEQRRTIKTTVAETVYWLVLLMFLPAILTALELEGLLRPVDAMVAKVFAFLPNLFVAALILLGGWLLARIVQRIVTNLLSAAGADALSEKTGLRGVLGKKQISDLLGFITYALILIPVLIAALNALRLQAITALASNMLSLIFAALPAIFAAGLLLVLAYAIGRLVASLIAEVLAGLGFDSLLTRFGVIKEQSQDGALASKVAGQISLVAIMLFAAAEAAELLGFQLFASLVNDFTLLAGQILLGLVIFGTGLLLANWASRAIREGGLSQAGLLGTAAQVAIIALAGAMALRQMGFANEIINLAFGLTLGALAVALAIAFGLGGRKTAGREIENMVDAIRTKKNPKPKPKKTRK